MNTYPMDCDDDSHTPPPVQSHLSTYSEVSYGVGASASDRGKSIMFHDTEGLFEQARVARMLNRSNISPVLDKDNAASSFGEHRDATDSVLLPKNGLRRNPLKSPLNGQVAFDDDNWKGILAPRPVDCTVNPSHGPEELKEAPFGQRRLVRNGCISPESTTIAKSSTGGGILKPPPDLYVNNARDSERISLRPDSYARVVQGTKRACSEASSPPMRNLLVSEGQSSAVTLQNLYPRTNDAHVYGDSSIDRTAEEDEHVPCDDVGNQIELDEILARRLQEQYDEELRRYGDSIEIQQVDTTIAWTLQEEVAENRRLIRMQNSSNAHSPSQSSFAEMANRPFPLPARRSMSRNFNSHEMNQEMAILSHLTRTFRSHQTDLDTRLNILESLEATYENQDYSDLMELNDDDYDGLWMPDEEIHHVGASDSQINALPLSVVKNNASEDACSICLECPDAGAVMRHLPCLHKFHKQCIDAWLKMRTLCPVCKFVLT